MDYKGVDLDGNDVTTDQLYDAIQKEIKVDKRKKIIGFGALAVVSGYILYNKGLNKGLDIGYEQGELQGFRDAAEAILEGSVDLFNLGNIEK